MGPDANNRSYISLTRSQTDRTTATVRPAPHYGAQTYGARSGQLLPRRRAGNKLGDAIAEPLRRKAKVLYSYLNGLTYAPTRQSSGTFLFAQILT